MRGVALILIGGWIGWYALLSGTDTGAAPPQAPAIPPPPAAPRPAVAEAAVYVVKPAPRVPLDQAASGLPLDPHQLTREIQLQLKRVGCYQGRLDGQWSPSVRQSMKAFLDRVNATLPTGQPDLVLLAILQGHQGAACDVSCPAGQALAADGRCRSHAVAARVPKKRALIESRSSRAAPASPFVDKRVPGRQLYDKQGRMSLAGPPPPGFAKRSGTNAPVKARRYRPEQPRPVSFTGRYPRWAVKAFNVLP